MIVMVMVVVGGGGGTMEQVRVHRRSLSAFPPPRLPLQARTKWNGMEDRGTAPSPLCLFLARGLGLDTHDRGWVGRRF